MESRCKQESQQREQRSERSERLRHTTTHLEPSCKHLEPSCKHLGPSCKHLQCKGRAKAAWWTHLQCKAHGSFCANSKPSCNSAKLMGHSVPTRSPPASVSSAKAAWWTHLESRCKQESQRSATRLHARNLAQSQPGSPRLPQHVAPQHLAPAGAETARNRTRKRCAGTSEPALEHFFVTATLWPEA